MSENIFDAMMMVFGMLVFILALSLTMMLFDKLAIVGRTIYMSTDNANQLKQVYIVNKDNLNQIAQEVAGYTERKVTKSSILPMLHRYYKEKFTIKIYDENGKLLQIFDTSLENEVNHASKVSSGLVGPVGTTNPRHRYTKTEYDQNVILGQYGNPQSPLFMFSAPWAGAGLKEEKDEFAKERVDLYIRGDKAYINGVLVDYTNANTFANYSDNTTFKEIVVKYQIQGNVRVGDKDAQEDGAEELVNDQSPVSKTEIIYIKENN